MRSGGTRVFISHNRKEKPWVREVVAQWRQLGLHVFFDEDSIQPGEDVISALEQGVADADHVVLVVSNASLASRWVAMETAMAMYGDPDGRDRRVIPVLIEPVDLKHLRLGLRRVNIVDLTDDATKHQRYQHLLRSLGIRETRLHGLSIPDYAADAQPPHATPPAGKGSRPPRDPSAPDPILRRILLSALAAVVVVLLVAYWWGRTHFDTNTVYVFDVPASAGGTQTGSNLFAESIDGLVQSIETNSTRPPYPEKSQVLLPDGDERQQPIICRMHASARVKDLERQIRLDHFIENCRKAILAAPRQSPTRPGAIWPRSSLTFDPDADRGKTIIIFSDLADDPAFMVAAGVNLYDACVAVIHVATSTGRTARLPAERTDWERRLRRWKTRQTRIWPLDAFDPEMVTDFARDCISTTR